MSLRALVRAAKNYTSYSDTQAKVRDATSNDPWGPSGTQMNEIAQLSYNQNDFVEIMEMLDKRLNDKGKNWRHVFKSLTVLNYLLHAGSQNAVLYFRDNLYIIKTLKEFQYVDEDAKDCGANVRQKAKDISDLLSDPARLQEERRTRVSLRDRMILVPPSPRPPGTPPQKANRGADRDEEELRKALETAISLNEEEEAKRHEAIDHSSSAAYIFDAQTEINKRFPIVNPTPYITNLQPQAQMQPQYTIQPKYTMHDRKLGVSLRNSNGAISDIALQFAQPAAQRQSLFAQPTGFGILEEDNVQQSFTDASILPIPPSGGRHRYDPQREAQPLSHDLRSVPPPVHDDTSFDTHEGPYNSSANAVPDVPTNFKPVQPLPDNKEINDRARDESAEGDEDDFSDLQQQDIYVKQPVLPDPERSMRSDAELSLRVTTSRRPNMISASQVPFVQAELDTHSSVPPETILQDLTHYITKTENHAVDRGGFGEIWKCTYQIDHGPIEQVAVKSLLVYTSDQPGKAMEKKTKRIQHELRTCARLEHANILPVYGYTYGFGRFMAIVSPWAENGNLTTYLGNEDASISGIRRFQILRDITAGLRYLHANNVIHGDLTGPNILIYGDGTACLADFGLSLVCSDVISISQASWTSNFHGNFRWLAPELLGEQDDELPVRPNKHSDIYSFGGIMLQVLTSKIPYYYLVNNAAVVRCIFTGDRPDRSRYPAFSDEYWHFIGECWSAVPHNRPSAERLVEVIRDELDSLSNSSSDS